MITIQPANKEFLAEIAAPANTDAMVLRDSDGTVLGHALFAVHGDTVEILSVVTDIPMMSEGLIRSVLNTGDYRGATIGLCRLESLAAMLKRLEFVPAEDGYTVSIQSFLYGDCKCH